MLLYDVLIVNPIMDGMNLVSKEGPAVNERDGVLVLSTKAGSFDELGSHAVHIEDPRDLDATARALEEALEMSGEERARRASVLRERARSRAPGDWINSQLDDLERVKKGEAPATPPAG